MEFWLSYMHGETTQLGIKNGLALLHTGVDNLISKSIQMSSKQQPACNILLHVEYTYEASAVGVLTS